MRRIAAAAILLCAGQLPGGLAGPAFANDYYRDKTINVVVASAPAAAMISTRGS